MPAFDASTPTITRTFAGQSFTVPAPYAEGGVLTANDAKFLNGQLASVIGNALSGDMRRAVEAWNKANPKNKVKDATELSDFGDLQALFDAKYTAYAPGESNRGSGTGTSGTDPIERMAHGFATQEAKARIIAKGYKVRDFVLAKSADGTQSKLAEFVAKLMTEKGDSYRAQAESIRANITTGNDDDMFGDIAPATEEATATNEAA